MFIYIFPYVGQLTDNYHSDGGLVVVANGRIDRALELINEHNDKGGSISLTSVEINSAIEYKIGGEAPEAFFVFPDAGCC